MRDLGTSVVHVNGVDLEYSAEGLGTPVVFVHGSASDLRYWEPQRRAFAARYRFVTYSRRFHGRRQWPADVENSTDAHVDDLVAIIRWLGAEPVHVVGFSTAIALHAALRAPGLIRSLTVIEPNVPAMLDDPAGQSVATWWREENERVRAEAAGDDERRAKLWFELVNNRGPGTFDAQPEGLRRMWLDNFGTPRPVPASEPLTCERLGAITMPTLLVAGEYGMPYSRRIVDRLAECIPGRRLVVVPSATHFMSYQDPAAFNDVVMRFLETSGGR